MYSGGLTHLLQAQSSHLFLPPGWHGAAIISKKKDHDNFSTFHNELQNKTYILNSIIKKIFFSVSSSRPSTLHNFPLEKKLICNEVKNKSTCHRDFTELCQIIKRTRTFSGTFRLSVVKPQTNGVCLLSLFNHLI